MTPPSADPLPSGVDSLQRATRQLRERSHARAVEISDDVLSNAMRGHRSSLPVRAHPPHGNVRISDQVIISELRRHIDGALGTAAVGRVFLRVDRAQALEELTIELVVQYGAVFMDVADRVRRLADDLLVELLGQPLEPLSVLVSHVHVSDITMGSPHVVDPSDE